MFSLRRTLHRLILASLAAVAAMAAVSVAGSRVVAHSVDRELVALGVTADILPPPLYLIELRLVMAQALDGTMNAATARTEQQRLVREYQARVDHYRAHPPYGLEATLLGEQHAAGERFIAESDQLLDALTRGPVPAATVASMHQAYLAHRAGVDQTVKAAGAFAAAASDDRARTEQGLFAAQVAVLALAALGVVLMGLGTLRATFRATGGEPAEVARVARAVAAGDMTVQVPVNAGDTRSVMAAMAQMCERLAGLVGGMRQHSDTISTSAQEIASGNLDLSRRTERQAAELEQTVATLAQFTAALRDTAHAAAQAESLGAAAAQGASQGATLVNDAVQTMDGIAQSSKRIGEITAVIDSIAFQTNILALNAAVEAARAGEQGRGFAVVAGEVRLLARRSGEAARQIHQLISASGTQVQQGARLVGEAGGAMQEIVRQVHGVTALIERIRHATQTQATGIGQVHETLGDLDGVTQQNAALVEQASAAADSLNQCASQLVALVQDIRVAPAHA